MGANTPHNLPEQPNALLGRDWELKVAREQLLSDNVRLLTLTGPPGVGKTRLALAVAESSLDVFPEGVWFINLAPLQDPALIESEIAGTFGIAERTRDMPFDSLVAYLQGRQILLVLDNFEGVLEAAPWIGRFLERTPGPKVLVTSRERLRLSWERTILVPPLPLPDLSLLPDLSALAMVPSVALFIQRATAAKADFTLSLENASVIAALCHRLDGLPLAIELAAANAGMLSPVEILSKMDDRFHLLAMGARDFPERHRTLKAAIDWSYESLPMNMRQFLSRLSVFKGGFSLKAVKFVTECEALGVDGFSSLFSLVEKSLVIRAQGLASEPRFNILESICEYLLDQLNKSGELDDARRRHAEYFLEMAEQTYAELKGPHQRAWLDVLECEHDNLRAALQWSLDTGEHSLGGRIAAALWTPFWWLQGHAREGLNWLEIFLTKSGELQDLTRLRVLEGVGMLRAWLGDYETGRGSLMDALQVSYQREEPEETIRILSCLGFIFWVNGKVEQAAWLAEKIEACPPDVDPWELAYAYAGLGSLFFDAGQNEAAESAFTHSLECFHFTEEKLQGMIFAEHKLALIKSAKGDVQSAIEEMVSALEAARQLNDLHVITFCVDDAVRLALQWTPERNPTRRPDLEELAQVLGAVDHWREILSLPRTPREKQDYLKTIGAIQRQLGEELYSQSWQAGRSISTEMIIRKASKLLKISYPPETKSRRLPEEGTISVPLSERERQVICLVAEGLSNQEIGMRLFVTERTVRFHITSIFNKFGANNRAQAVAMAHRLGLL